MSDFDTDELDHDCEPLQPRAESLQIYDFIGIFCQTTGAVVATIGNGFMATGQEFYAAARLRRIRQDEHRRRTVEGLALERMVNGDA